MNEYLTVDRRDGLLQIRLRNDWVFSNLNNLQHTLEQIEPDTESRVRFSCGGLQDFDLAGAWILYERSMDFEEQGVETNFEGFQAGGFRLGFSHRRSSPPTNVSKDRRPRGR